MPKRNSTKDSNNAEPPYRHPVPGGKELLGIFRDRGEPMTLDDLAKALDLRSPRHVNTLAKKLRQMVQQGQIIKNRSAEYCLTARIALVAGVVQAHRDGFGFLLRDDGKDDVYLSAREMRSLFDGDRIAIRVISRRNSDRTAGKLVEVLERNTEEIAGRYIRERGISLVVPDSPRLTQHILIPARKRGGAEPGQLVIVRLIDYPTETTQATGEITSVLGEPGERGVASELAIHAHNIPHVWSDVVREQAEGIGEAVAEKAMRGRTDLRELPLVTIDGADARDFDDAVWASKDNDGFRLVVAIADVAHYVQPESAIDREAQFRGTSVYFPDRVVPMLPESLSNGLCSLRPDVDRLALVCDMRFDNKGKVESSKFYDAVIRSSKRLTYSAAFEFISRSNGESHLESGVAASLETLHELYKKLDAVRRRRGALEIDIPQLRIVVDEQGEVSAIRPQARNDAHKLIEECMIAANVEAARFLTKNKLFGLFRIHAGPKAARFDEFREYMLTLGFKVPLAEHVQPKDFRRLLADIRERPDAHAISVALLRSMAHAEYTPENSGHFGLALKSYAHFTSPIRRYPDLLVHRAIKHKISGGKPGAYRYSNDDMVNFGKFSSAHERRAEEATREVEAVLKCQYMADKVGDVFTGTIATVTAFGLFVLLDELNVEGLVHVSGLSNDYYEYDAASQSLVGARRRQRFTLGQNVTVRVAKVDMEQRHIDFSLEAQ